MNATSLARLLGTATLVAAACTDAERGITDPAALSPAVESARFPAWSEPVGLGAVNTTFGDQQPALSKDGLTLYFSSSRPEFDGDAALDNNIWVARRDCLDCPWQSPRLVGPPVSGPANDNTPSLSRDEHRLYFATTRVGGPGGNDIWVASRPHVHDAFAWESAAPLGPGVNSPANENGASYFENEEGGAPQLYFNRQTGAGGVAAGDIFVSELGAAGEWGVATPVVELNSPDADQRPSVRHDGLAIYFWSGREGGQGQPGAGFLWYSERNAVGDPWSAPRPVESPIAETSSIQPFIHSHGRTETLVFVHNVAGPGGMDLDIVMSTRTRGGPPE